MSSASPTFISYEDYLEAEDASDERHEWCEGVIYPPPIASIERGRLGAEMIFALGGERTRCELLAATAMIYIAPAQLSTYASLTIVCGKIKSHRTMRDGKLLGEALINPTVIVETLSFDRERYLRDAKFKAYQQLPSLEEYVLVSEHEPCIEVYRRAKQGPWTCELARAGEHVGIHGARIEVDKVYRNALER